MLKATFVKATAEQAADGTCYRHPIFTPQQVGANLEHCWVIVQPYQATSPHRHAQAELWVVYVGQGEARIGGACAPIHELDAILVPPEADHHLANTGGHDLILLCATWNPVGPVLEGCEGIALEPFDRARLQPAHQDTFYFFEPFSTKAMGGPPRFTTGWGLVGGGVASELHQHPTAELYVFFRGAAVQQVGLECAQVKATDSVMVPAHTMHNLLNYTDREVLLYWIEVIPGSLPE